VSVYCCVSILLFEIFITNNESFITLYFSYNPFFYFFTTALQYPPPPVGQDLLINEDSLSHSDTPHSVGLLWTNEQPNRRKLYLTTLNTHNRQTSMSSAGFEPIIPANERPQNHSLDGAATGIGTHSCIVYYNLLF